MPRHSLDELGGRYGAPPAGHGHDSAALEAWHAEVVPRFLRDHAGEDCVLDLGAGHAVFSGANLETVRPAFAAHRVVLLLPARGIDESLALLARRNEANAEKRDRPHAVWNRYFLSHPAPAALAARTVYLGERDAQSVAEELAGLYRDA